MMAAQDRRAQAASFVAALTGSADVPVTFQTFPDGEGESSAAPLILHATLADAWERLEDAQEYGHGIFIMVNEGDGHGRSGVHVVGLRALFADNDADDGNVAAARMPDIVVSSGRGWHYYYLLQRGEPLSQFTPAQKAIAARLGTDPKVCDLARVMRLPGTYNLKDRSKPRLVELVHVNERPARRTITGTLAYLQISQADVHRQATAVVAAPGDDVLLASSARQRAEAYVSKIFAVEGEGGDVATFRVAAALLRDFNLDRDTAWDVLKQWNATNASPPWSEKDLAKKYMNANRHGKAPIGAKLAEQMERALDANAGDAIEAASSTDPRLDPANWVYDPSQRGRPWRRWRAGGWADGISNADLERLLQNEGGLTKRAAAAWQKKAPVVEYAAPIFASRERIAVLDDGTKVANTFRAPTLEPLRGEWKSIEAVLRNLAGHDEQAYRYIIGWLAKVVQRAYAGCPKKIGVALVFHGTKGTGKGVLEVVLQALLGKANVACVAQGDIDNAHMAWLVGKLAVCADEVLTSENRGAAALAKLKNLITAATRQINPKGRDQIQVDCAEAWLFFSNSHRPVEVEKNDRRFAIFKTGPAIPVELGAEVADDARAGGPMVRAFLAHLLSMPERDLAPDYKPPKESAAKDEVRAASGNSGAKFALEISARGFYSATAAWAATQVSGGPRDLYLMSPGGEFRSVGHGGVCGPAGPLSPVILTRKLMEVYRAYCASIAAPAVQETTLLAALREELPLVLEVELLVDGRRERAVAGLPGALPEDFRAVVAAPEQPLPTQRTLNI